MATERSAAEAGRRRLAGCSTAGPASQVSLLLAGPLGWLGVAYLGSLAVLFIAAFWQLDTFSGEVVHEYGFQNFETIVESDMYRTIVLRTVADRRAVTVADMILAFPIAFFMAKVAAPRARTARRRRHHAAVVLLPGEGVRVADHPGRGRDPELVLDPFGLEGPGFGNFATWLVFTYLWLPFMVLPIYAGLERMPDSLLDASGDLGGGAVDDVPRAWCCRWPCPRWRPARSSRSR